MELMFDWRAFQSTFYPARRTATEGQRESRAPVFAVVDQDRIVAAYAEQENLQEWVGCSLSATVRQNPHREWKVIPQSAVHAALSVGQDAGQFYDQVDKYRSHLKESLRGVPTQKSHFLVDALRGWWRRLLPTAYGLCLELTSENGAPSRYWLLLVRRGRLEGFHEPDLSACWAGARRTPTEIAKYLSERYLVPTLVLSLPIRSWSRWSLDSDPWGEVARAVFRKQISMSYRSLGLRLLVYLRAVLL